MNLKDEEKQLLKTLAQAINDNDAERIAIVTESLEPVRRDMEAGK